MTRGEPTTRGTRRRTRNNARLECARHRACALAKTGREPAKGGEPLTARTPAGSPVRRGPHWRLQALITLILLLASSSSLAHAAMPECADAANFAPTWQSPGPPRPAEGWRLAGPWRAQLASTPGRELSVCGGAAWGSDRRHCGYAHSGFGKVLKSTEPGGIGGESRVVRARCEPVRSALRGASR
jgi:hypothetical protein